MKRNLQLRSAHRGAANAMAVMIAGAGFFVLDPGLQAQEREQAHALPEVERAFWICDYMASTRRLPAATGAACMAIYDQLKARKFGGDYDALQAWWQTNKTAAHREIETAGRLASARHGREMPQ